MRVISSSEFRKDQKNYFDLADKEEVIVTRKNNQPPIHLKPITDKQETEMYFSDRTVLEQIKQGIDDINNGKVTTVDNISDIWEDIK